MATKRPEVYQGKDNIFAELGRPDSEIHMLKAQIVAELYRLATQRR
jgi:hypothetical protein